MGFKCESLMRKINLYDKLISNIITYVLLWHLHTSKV